ncbi:MAG: cytochrome c biogenesis CcdA family protein [Acidimicrobiia bacterium]
MFDVPVGLAFTAGMVATVNPCGFAMLPAYLSFFVGADGEGKGAGGAGPSTARAVVVGVCVTAGFAAAFGTVALVVNLFSDGVYDVAPWLSLVIGAALVVTGIAYVAGFQLNVKLPHLERGGRTTGAGSMVLFGISYAVASIGCMLPLYAPVFATSFNRGLTSGIAYFAAFVAGFGLLVTGLTVTLALARLTLVRGLRRALPYVNRVAGTLLVLTGAYIAYYGTVEIRTGQGQGVPDSAVVDVVTRWSSEAQNWIAERSTTLGWLLAVAVAAGVGSLVMLRERPARKRSTSRT